MNDKSETKYYLTDSPIKEIKGDYARWWISTEDRFPIFSRDKNDGTCFSSLEEMKLKINLNKDGNYDIKPVEFINGVFNRVIKDKEIYPEKFDKKSNNTP
jgi:hypothetical protein